jgi:HAE1 family hydrophobic/amphiphilic exporter-1
MEGVPNTSGVTSTLDADERVLEIIVDRKKAAALGFTETQVTGIVAAQLRPSPLGRVSVEGDDVSVYVAGADLPESIDEIKALVIPSFTGLVRLDTIASVEEVLKPTSITSKEGNRTAKVSIAPEGDDLGAITLDITNKLDEIELPAGVTATIGGAAADQAESFQQLGLALLAAIAIVYVVMVATFGSLIQPLLLLVSIPFAATGALGLLLLTDTPLGVPALIGMLMLIGIVVTNAIVLIDLVNQYRKEGRSVEDSLISGARQRLRPILMTALATIFALTPMAMGLTGNSGFISQPLAIVVIGGLFSSTLLTLILVPTLYWLVEGRKERKAIRVARREAKALKKAEKQQAKLEGKATAAAAPAAVITEPEAAKPQVVEAPLVVEAPEVVEEVTEDAIADAIAETFTPAAPAETPNLSWSISQEEVELDSEATMQWSESKTETAPIAAVQQPEESLDFLTRENPIVQEPSKQDLKAQRKAEKAELKTQKKAAKNSRHSGD